MSRFLQIPEMTVTVLNPKPFRRGVILRGDLVYESDILGASVTVPEGTMSDGASVPQFFWNRYPPFGQYLNAAVVHDWYCILGHAGKSPVDFKTAALIFREAMAVEGVGKWKRNVMYQAVRWFGPRFKAVDKKEEVS